MMYFKNLHEAIKRSCCSVVLLFAHMWVVSNVCHLWGLSDVTTFVVFFITVFITATIWNYITKR